ncbi:MAG TPA: hypothetical protein V6D23_09905, partial [Candidatus Obscuribacterales bacterium]
MTQPPEDAQIPDTSPTPIGLPEAATMVDYQRYIAELEARMGWQDVDLVQNCFLMGEEVGELFKAVRRVLKFFDQDGDHALPEARREQVGEELVDVMNYLLAIANRLDIDLESAF